jgi:hypothetical protein
VLQICLLLSSSLHAVCDVERTETSVSHPVKVCLLHLIIHAAQLDKHHSRRIPHVLDLLVDKVLAAAHLGAPGRNHFLLEDLFELVLKDKFCSDL